MPVGKLSVKVTPVKAVTVLFCSRIVMVLGKPPVTFFGLNDFEAMIVAEVFLSTSMAGAAFVKFSVLVTAPVGMVFVEVAVLPDGAVTSNS